MVLNSLVVQHNKGVNHTMNQLTHFINYSTYHPFVEIKYYHINIILYTSSDALYIFDPEGCIHVDGYFLISPTPPPRRTKDNAACKWPCLHWVWCHAGRTCLHYGVISWKPLLQLLDQLVNTHHTTITIQFTNQDTSCDQKIRYNQNCAGTIKKKIPPSNWHRILLNYGLIKKNHVNNFW